MKKTKRSVSQSASRKESKSGPKKSDEIPVTKRMLFEVRDELKESISALRMEFKADFHGLKSEIHGMKSEIDGVKSEIRGMKSEIDGVKSEIHGMKSDIRGMKSEIHGMKSEIHGMKSEISGMKSEIHGMKSELHRVALLVEEQNARNIFVLDGLTGLYGRQDRVEAKTDAVEVALLLIKREYERRQAEKQP